MRVAQRVQQPGRRAIRSETLKRGRVRRDRPEQRVLITHRPEIGEAIAAVGEHHRQVAHHAPGIVPGLTLLQTRQAHRQRPGEPALIGDLRQQRAARMRHKPFSVRRDFYRDVAAIALHLQGDPPEPVLGPSQAEESLLSRTFPRPDLGRGAHLAARSGLAVERSALHDHDQISIMSCATSTRSPSRRTGTRRKDPVNLVLGESTGSTTTTTGSAVRPVGPRGPRGDARRGDHRRAAPAGDRPGRGAARRFGDIVGPSTT